MNCLHAHVKTSRKRPLESVTVSFDGEHWQVSPRPYGSRVYDTLAELIESPEIPRNTRHRIADFFRAAGLLSLYAN